MKVLNRTRISLFLLVSAAMIVLSFVSDSVVPAKPNELTATPVAPPNALTGIWKGDDSATYYLRHEGNTLWWLGKSPDGGATFTNIFHGTINGGQLVGSWADVPAGRYLGTGSMTISIVPVSGDWELRKQSQTGNGFGATVWRRSGRGSGSGGTAPGVCTIFGAVRNDRPSYNTRLTLYRDGRPTQFSTAVSNG